MIYAHKRRRGARVGLAQLIAMTLTPAAHAIERGFIHFQLAESARAVEVYKRKSSNDHKAIAFGFDSPAIRQQLKDNAEDIAQEHRKQARLSIRLTEIR